MSGPAPALHRKIGTLDLTLFNISVVAGLRSFASLAHEGPRAIPLMMLCTAIYFLPMAILFAALGRRFPQEGGFYVWIHEAFGPWHAFLSAWLYSIAILLLFPAVIMFGAGIGPHILGPGYSWLADAPAFVITATLTLLWGGSLLNILGMRITSRLTNIGAMCTYATLTILGIAAVLTLTQKPSATHFTFALSWDFATFNTWAQMTYFVTGLELAGLIAGEVADPARTVPRAALLSSFAIAIFFVSGAASILAVLPAGEVHPVYGIAQAAAIAGQVLHAPWLPALLAAVVALSAAAQFAGLMAASSRLPYLFGIDRYLPSAFGRLHPGYGTPYVSILCGAVVSSAFVLGMCLGETVRAAYTFLFDAAILLNAVPFLYIFAAGWKLGYRTSAALGFVVTLTALVFSLVPGTEVTNVVLFEFKMIGALCIMSVAAWLLYRR